MRRLLYLFFASVVLTTLVSCSKEFAKAEDADAFVGTYRVTIVENVVWGGDSGTLNDNGTLRLEKISANKVQIISNFIYEQADVAGNMIYIPGDTFSDSAGYYTRSYSSGILSGNVLTFTRYHTGQLASYGVLYPYRSTAQFTAIKQ